MKVLLFFLLPAICILSFQCKKSNPNSDNGLPPATQTGQGMFACRVNGLPWISDRGIYNIGGGLNNDTFDIFGTKKYNDGHIERLIIRLEGIFKTNQQVYQLNDTTNAYAV